MACRLAIYLKAKLSPLSKVHPPQIVGWKPQQLVFSSLVSQYFMKPQAPFRCPPTIQWPWQKPVSAAFSSLSLQGQPDVPGQPASKIWAQEQSPYLWFPVTEFQRLAASVSRDRTSSLWGGERWKWRPRICSALTSFGYLFLRNRLSV